MADEPITPPEGGPPTPPAEKTFTQTELEHAIGERLARERAKYEGFDELKAKAARLDEIEESSRTDLDKAVKRAEKAETERDAAMVRANDTLTRSAIVAEAAEKGALVPGDVYTLLTADPAFKEHRDKVIIGDDGQVTGHTEAVQAVLEARQNLVGQTRPGPGDGGARPPATPSAAPGDPEQQHNQLLAGIFGGPT